MTVETQGKILLVEDDVDILDNLKTVLEMENYSVATVTNGRLALDFLKKERPALILLDLMMPIMNGYEMLAEITQLNLYQNHPVPIILLSASTDIEETARKQVVKFIRKPIALDQLLATIKDVLNSH